MICVLKYGMIFEADKKQFLVIDVCVWGLLTGLTFFREHVYFYEIKEGT